MTELVKVQDDRKSLEQIKPYITADRVGKSVSNATRDKEETKELYQFFKLSIFRVKSELSVF